MASSSAVELTAVKELSYGITPPLDTVVAETVRFVSESLSGTPITTQSAELRKDRMSGGQVVTGLESGGDINIELSINDLYEDFMAGAMMNAWVEGFAAPAAAITLTKDATNPQLATISPIVTSDFDGAGRDLAVGDIIILSGFATAANNGPVQVTEVVDISTAQVVVPRSAVTEVSDVTGGVQVGDYVDIGSLIESWTLSKSYTDVLHLATTDEHSQRYSGSIVNRMAINIAYGELITGSFGFLSNGYIQEFPSLHQKIDAAGGTVEPAETNNPLNGSIDMPLVTVDGQPTDFCIQSIGIELNNGATPQNCIGHIAPMKYNLGTANIAINTSIYLGDQAYDKFMPAKLSQLPISFAFSAVDPVTGNGYTFDLRAVQLTFPDPAASGEAPVIIEASGVAKVGPDGSSALRIWRF